jgi:hypothetical protein
MFRQEALIFCLETAVKEMTDKMATADDDVPWDLLILLGGDGLKIVTHLINNIQQTGE